MVAEKRNTLIFVVYSIETTLKFISSFNYAFKLGEGIFLNNSITHYNKQLVADS